jgi:serine/threonine protein kinase
MSATDNTAHKPDACPNVGAHRAQGAGNKHALGRKSLAKLMLRQLTENPDNGCEPLGKQGACGALFRLTLESYRYTFVAKGTVTAFTAKLKHECLIYRHLDEVQGELIPVYLGNISLVRPYFLDFGVRIVHMLFMSWAGEQARKDLVSSLGRDMDEETAHAVINLRHHGVEHRDVRPPNILWNPEGRKVMLVDFERSEILKQAPILQEISPNRKRKLPHSIEGACTVDHLISVLSKLQNVAYRHPSF